MKRLLYLSLAALMVLAVSCDKNSNGGGKTKSSSVETLEATDIKTAGACLHARISFANDDWDGVNYGFYWGTSEDALDTYIMAKELLDEENAYFAVLSDLVPDTQYWYKAWAEIDDKEFFGEVKSFKTKFLPEGAIDLGIVISKDGTSHDLYWAASNLCEDGLVDSPELFGDYYAWGETEPHYAKGHSQDNPCSNWRVIDGKTMTGYNLANYKWYDNSTGKITKYNAKQEGGVVDNNLELDCGDDPEDTTIDDAARYVLGGKWRMPTKGEWEALQKQCKWDWTDNYNDIGIKGFIVKSQVPGYTGSSIFLPAAGERESNALRRRNEAGFYWSSSLKETASVPLSWQIQLGYTGTMMHDCNRDYGCPVRPVYED